MKQRTQEQISYNMSRIKCKGTSIERFFGKKLWKEGIRYRKNYVKLIGKPDFVVVCQRLAIFCDSEFWHGYKRMETKRHEFKVNEDFWMKKIQGNIERDKEVNAALKRLGWKVIRFWDFEIKKESDKCVKKILRILNK